MTYPKNLTDEQLYSEARMLAKKVDFGPLDRDNKKDLHRVMSEIKNRQNRPLSSHTETIDEIERIVNELAPLLHDGTLTPLSAERVDRLKIDLKIAAGSLLKVGIKGILIRKPNLDAEFFNLSTLSFES